MANDDRRTASRVVGQFHGKTFHQITITPAKYEEIRKRTERGQLQDLNWFFVTIGFKDAVIIATDMPEFFARSKPTFTGPND